MSSVPIHTSRDFRSTSRSDSGNFAAMIAVFALMTSGIAHLVWLWVMQEAWEGPVSPRKPALFGISAGLTAWSLVWVGRQLDFPRSVPKVASMIVWGLFLEVALITVQYWRGVPSHFNRTTLIDHSIELAMVGLIIAATIGIGWIFWAAMKSSSDDAARMLAIRAGLAFLFISCLLGFATMAAGEFNIAQGLAPEIWGRAGVLKYPHGAILHAIQTLPILNLLLTRLKIPNRLSLIWFVIGSHVFFLISAIWQTLNGRSRLDLDIVGGTALLASVLLIIVPVVSAMIQFLSNDAVKISKSRDISKQTG